MVLIACVDEKLGMLFHNRRVSRDQAVCSDILSMCKGQPLYMTAASAKLFGEPDAEYGENIHVEERLWEAPKGAVCFVEDPEGVNWHKAEKLVLYHWNRRYPADRYFPVELAKWKLVSREEFPGFSHEKISKEVYVRENV